MKTFYAFSYLCDQRFKKTYNQMAVKQLERAAKKCEKESKSEKAKIKKVSCGCGFGYRNFSYFESGIQ